MGNLWDSCNSVSPTVVLTALGHKAWDGPVGDAFKETIPAKRFAEPEEIASVIAFLCSKGAGMITGHNLLVDGGFTINNIDNTTYRVGRILCKEY